MAFTLQDYQIIEEIGQGGFGTVLKARQKSLGKVVAIKYLSPQKTQNKEEILRFRKEAEAMALVAHDNIVSILDYAYFNSNYYIVMEFIDGITLEEALSSNLSTAAALYIMEKVVSGLQLAHEKGIMHRDIKPGNILLGKQGQIKLADFGLATIQVDATKYLSTDAIMGTFCYMSPEAMVNPHDIDERVDIFSLGCILYQILSGTLPFPGSTLGEISYNVINANPKPLHVSAPFLPLKEIINQCLEKDRAKRPSLQEVHSALQQCLSNNYHAASRELKDFLNKGEIKTDVTKASTLEFTSNRPKLPLAKVAIITPIIAIGSFLLFIAIFFLTEQSTMDLPQLQALQDSSPAFSSSAKSLDESSSLSKNAPKPVTSTSPSTASGTLILKGIVKGDSIQLNNKPLSLLHYKAQQELTLKPGHYRVTLFRKNQSPLIREVHVMPYQKLTLDINQERKRTGNGS